MSALKEWVIQIRYPYTAGVIAVMWMGTAVLAIIRPEVSAQLLITLVALATLIIALVGFTSGRR